MRTALKTGFIFLFICLFTTIPALASTIIMQSGCDVFTEPTTQSASIGHAGTNQEMTYLGAWSEDDRGMRWYRVDWRGKTGWVPARYGMLSTEKSDYMSRLPSYYIGAWQGGKGKPAAGEYYLYVKDFINGELFQLDFDIYRTWGFDQALAVIEGYDYATFEAEDDQYSVIGKLDFLEDGLALTILISNYPELPEGTYIVFERAAF